MEEGWVELGLGLVGAGMVGVGKNREVQLSGRGGVREAGSAF